MDVPNGFSELDPTLGLKLEEWDELRNLPHSGGPGAAPPPMPEWPRARPSLDGCELFIGGAGTVQDFPTSARNRDRRSGSSPAPCILMSLLPQGISMDLARSLPGFGMNPALYEGQAGRTRARGPGTPAEDWPKDQSWAA